jgi:hypothetical protein
MPERKTPAAPRARVCPPSLDDLLRRLAKSKNAKVRLWALRMLRGKRAAG